jgi:hypothetical protein
VEGGSLQIQHFRQLKWAGDRDLRACAALSGLHGQALYHRRLKGGTASSRWRPPAHAAYQAAAAPSNSETAAQKPKITALRAGLVHCCCRCSNRNVYASFGIGRRGAGVGRNQAYKICPILSRNSLPPRGSKQDAPSLRAAVVQGGLRRMPLGAEQPVQLIGNQRFTGRRSGRGRPGGDRQCRRSIPPSRRRR